MPPDVSADAAACLNMETETQAKNDPLISEVLPIETRQQTPFIQKLRRKLFRRSFPSMPQAYSENPSPLDAQKFSAALTALCNPAPSAWRERMYCAWLLGHAPLTPAQQLEATRALGSEVQFRYVSRYDRFRAHLRRVEYQTLPLAVISALWITLPIIRHGTHHHTTLDLSTSVFMVAGMFLALYVSLFPSVFLLSALLNMRRVNSVRVAAILALARLRAPEAIGPLSRAALDVSHGIRVVAEESLRQCLPQITPDHYGRLDADTVPALCKLLDVKKERLFAGHLHTEQLVLDVLDALGKIGDGSAVRHVESVAEDGWTSSARDAARQILPLLRQRQQQENELRLLLRGSTPPPTSPDQLLRPTLPTPHTAPELLLRSGSRE